LTAVILLRSSTNRKIILQAKGQYVEQKGNI